MAGEQFDQIWDMYVQPLKSKIAARSKEIAANKEITANAEQPEATAADIFDAIREYIPGNPVKPNPVSPAKELGWWNKNVTGFIGITATLTILFGILGVLPLFKDNLPKDFVPVASGFLEIAKIFAGALVGGAAGAAAVSSKSRG